MTLKLGTRKSPLAMVQAQSVKACLLAIHKNLQIEIVEISTTGDKIQDRRLSEIGGKGLFTKELDVALIDGRCDIVVHSLKDVETNLPNGTTIACVLSREATNDVLIANNNLTLDSLPTGAIVGTTSLRRQAQILQLRQDVKVVMFRGNVGTRLKKLANGEADATLLALAGLNRLDMANVATEILDTDSFIPAVGQGAICVQCRQNDLAIIDILKPINCQDTLVCVQCERAMLDALDGTCKTPVGGLAVLDGSGNITLTGFVSTADGKVFKRLQQSAVVENANAMGRQLGLKLRQAMGDDFDRM